MTTTNPAMDFATIAVGEEFALDLTVTDEMIAQFVDSSQDDSPQARAGTLPAPYFASDYLRCLRTRYSTAGTIHTHQWCLFGEPAPVGEAVLTLGRVVEKFVKKGRPTLVVACESRGATGQLLAETRGTVALRYRPAGEGEKPLLSGRAPVATGAGGRGGEGPPSPLIRQVTAATMTQFAGQNPIHTDPAFARAHGLPAPIAAGNLTVAYFGQWLARSFGADWAPGTELAVTFVRPAYEGDRLEMGGEPDAKGGNERAWRLWCRNQNGETIAVGRAVLG